MFIGEIILQRRKELNMTQKELAEKLNVTDRTISRWEGGVSLPDVEMLKTVSIVLNVDINYFYSDVKTKEINYEEEYDYERIKKYKINALIPYVLLIFSLLMIVILKIVLFEITATLGLFSNIHQMIDYTIELGVVNYVVWIVIISIVGIIIALISLFLHLKNNISFKYFYLGKVHQNVYLSIFKKISIPYDIIMSLLIFYLLI